MWFLFGFITIVGFCFYAAYKKLNASWIGTIGSCSGLKYQSTELRNKYKIVGFLIGIESHEDADYTFKGESGVDRWFKSIGISSEFQVGKKEFDELVYIVTDNTDFQKHISSNEEILNSVIEIFKVGDKYGHTTKEIRHNSGKLWVKFKSGVKVKAGDVDKISSEIVPLLGKIDQQIKSVKFSSINKWKDPFVIKAVVILAISTGLTLNGLAHIMRFIWGDIPFTLDVYPLFIDSIIYGSIVILVLITSTFILLGRSARTHLVIIELLIVGYFGAVSTSFAELRDLNMELDHSSSIEFGVQANKKRISRQKNSTNYYVYVDDWTEEKTAKRVEVSGGFYHSILVGDKLIISQKDGFLNYKWVESIRKHNE